MPGKDHVMASFADTVRLSLHVLAATIWVGGQFTLAGLLPVLRTSDPDLPRRAARAFNRIAWPAFGVLLVTGFWNIAATDDDTSDAYGTVLTLKLLAVAGSGLTAWAHIRASSRAQLAIFGALTAVTAVAAVVLGVVLAG
jgi:putative copper export protein